MQCATQKEREHVSQLTRGLPCARPVSACDRRSSSSRWRVLMLEHRQLQACRAPAGDRWNVGSRGPWLSQRHGSVNHQWRPGQGFVDLAALHTANRSCAVTSVGSVSASRRLALADDCRACRRAIGGVPATCAFGLVPSDCVGLRPACVGRPHEFPTLRQIILSFISIEMILCLN